MPWYYYRGGVRRGPIEDPAFRQMAATGELEPTDFVWSPGMKEWAQAATVPGILAPPPPPPERQTEGALPVLVDGSVRSTTPTAPISEITEPRQSQESTAAQVGLKATEHPGYGRTVAGGPSKETASRRRYTNWYYQVMNRPSDFQGRARRREYWWFFLVNWIITILVGVAGLAVKTSLLLTIYAVIVFLPFTAVSARRLHDIGRSGWYQFFPLLVGFSFTPLFGVIDYLFATKLLIFLLPLVIGASFVYLFVLLMRDSQPGTNKYGPNPKGTNTA